MDLVNKNLKSKRPPPLPLPIPLKQQQQQSDLCSRTKEIVEKKTDTSVFDDKLNTFEEKNTVDIDGYVENVNQNYIVSTTSTTITLEQQDHLDESSSEGILNNSIRNSIKEFEQYKSTISEGLKKLENFFENFKKIAEPTLNKTQKPQQTMASIMNSNNKSTNNTSTSMISNNNNQNVDDLRSVLSDIDQHLSILKEIEQRNTIICESFSKEIRSRDEALLERMKQISIMNHEMATMQAKMQHLILKNSQLENEVKYLKTASSFTNTEASSTPVLINDNDNVQSQQSSTATTTAAAASSMNIIGSLSKFQQPTPTMIDEKLSSSATDISMNASDQKSKSTKILNDSLENNQQQAAIYHDLLIQYRKIEQLIQQSQTYKIQDPIDFSVEENNCNKANQLSIESSTCDPTVKVMDLAHKNQNDHQDNQNDDLLMTTDKTIVQEKLNLEFGKPENIIQQQSMFDFQSPSMALSSSKPETPTKTPPTAILLDSTTLFENGQQQQQQSSQFVDVQQQQQETSTKFDEEQDQLIDYNLIDNEDVVATSIKAYEHFVKMQHDLEILMRKEIDYRNKIVELERENEQLKQKVKDDEYSLSDVQYELGILKHNYELEIESFSTAINERETLIEKLQQKIQSLKGRYLKLEDRLKTASKTEIELNAQIEELQGRLKYEQLQKQTLIDLRISELECKLQQQEHEYRLEIQNLKTDLVCSESVCKELEKKIEDLENSLKSLTSADFEDEFIYYKNQIDTLIKELDKEKQEHQRCREQFEQEIRAKDKLLEQAKEQLKRDKDSINREKTEYEQRYRKMLTKLKTKEEEIKQLHQKILILNDKFQNIKDGNYNSDVVHPKDLNESENVNKKDNNSESSNDKNKNFNENDNPDKQNNKKSPEQLLTELTLNEIKLNEFKEQLEDYEERFKQLQQQLFSERNRRRQLETFYLNSLNKNKNGCFNKMDYDDDDFDEQYDHFQTEEWINLKHSPQENDLNHLHSLHYHHQQNSIGGAFNRRESSQASLALLMDESAQMAMVNAATSIGQHSSPISSTWNRCDDEQSYYVWLKRWLRRQKNIFLFGRTRAKLIRIIVLLYLFWIHYLAIGYKFGTTNATSIDSSSSSPSIQINNGDSGDESIFVDDIDHVYNDNNHIHRTDY